jgi:hypothetical protein
MDEMTMNPLWATLILNSYILKLSDNSMQSKVPNVMLYIFRDAETCCSLN